FTRISSFTLSLIRDFSAASSWANGLPYSLFGAVILHRRNGDVQRFGGVVRTQVGTVTEDRPVIHQPVFLVNGLSALDLLGGGDHVPCGADHLCRAGGHRLIYPISSDQEDSKADQKRDDQDLLQQILPYRRGFSGGCAAFRLHPVSLPSLSFRTISI